MQTPDFRTLPLKTLSALLISLTLTACGGGDSDSRFESDPNGIPGATNGNGNGNGADNDDDGDDLDSAPEGQLGSFEDGTFYPGAIGSSSSSLVDEESPRLLPAGNARLSVTLQDTRGGNIDADSSVTFSSECLSSEDATLTTSDGEAIEDHTVALEGGIAEVVYLVNGCLGEDEVRAQSSYENSSIDTATTTVEITPPRFGSGQGEDFTENSIDVDKGGQVLQPDESTEIAVSLVDPDNLYASGSSTVSFSSSCLDEGLATLTDGEGSIISGPVETESGLINLTYTANGCLNEDTLKATATYEGVESGEAEATISHVPARFGRGISDAFASGEIEVGIGDAVLSAGGKTSLEVTLVDEQGDLIPVPVTVAFNSYCLARDESMLTIGDETPETFSTDDGVLQVTYTATGCDQVDNITATAFVGETEIGKARAAIEVEADAAQNIVFTSANPELISVKGAGGDESSSLTFQVLGTTGTPLKEVPVTFSLSNEMGGTYLSHTAATSDASGNVSTTVNAGTVPNTVRVTATAGDVTTESSRLTISTGIPDQNSFSLSVENHFPAAAWNIDGVETNVTIRLADAYNNPAPDGTAVYFTTSGGAIDSTCLSTDGTCTVTWRSQSPRPGRDNTPMFSVTEQTDVDGEVSGFSIDPCPNGMSECRHGRVRVLATALGNESFIDETGNAMYDGPAEDIFATGGNCDRNRPTPSAEILSSDADVITANACDDLGEAYLDKNFNGQRDTAEEYVDGDENGSFTPGDGIYNGILCSEAAEAAGDCTKDTVTIRDHQTIVMTCDTPYYMPGSTRLPGQRDVELAQGQTTTVTMLLADCNGNGMPEGTEVSLDESGVRNVAAQVSPEDALSASGDPSAISITFEADDTEPASGTLGIVITAPSGDGTKESRTPISITHP